MTLSRNPLYLVAAFILILHPIVASAKSRPIPANYKKTIRQWIKSEIQRSKPEDAPFAAVDGSIRTYTGDLDADGDRDCIALYNGSFGGNAVTQYMVVFLNNDGKLSEGHQTEVGGTGTVMLGALSITKGVIVSKTTVWNEDDANCCPSGKGTVSYVFHNGQIERI